jgi:anti-sigma B factor antagonist
VSQDPSPPALGGITVLSVPTDHTTALTVSIDWVHGAVVLRGELDRDAAHHLIDALAALRAAGHPRWVVDAAEVTWCDAGGLRALACAHALAVESGRELRLVRPSRCVHRLITLSGLDQLLAATDPPAADGAGAAARTGRRRPPRPLTVVRDATG